MGSQLDDGGIEGSAGHVGILRFEDEEELRDFLETAREEISGFYECRSGSRPSNFQALFLPGNETTEECYFGCPAGGGRR